MKRNPVHPGPVMMCFTKDVEIFWRFCVVLIPAYLPLISLKKVGVDTEAAIFRASFASCYSCTLHNTCIKEMKRQLADATRRAVLV